MRHTRRAASSLRAPLSSLEKSLCAYSPTCYGRNDNRNMSVENVVNNEGTMALSKAQEIMNF